MPSGYAILGKYQPDAVRGCCMLLPDPVVASPNDLSHAQRAQFFSDLVLLGDAVLEVTGAERINYLVLCNQVPELPSLFTPRAEAARTRPLGWRQTGPVDGKGKLDSPTAFNDALKGTMTVPETRMLCCGQARGPAECE